MKIEIRLTGSGYFKYDVPVSSEWPAENIPQRGDKLSREIFDRLVKWDKMDKSYILSRLKDASITSEWDKIYEDNRRMGVSHHESMLLMLTPYLVENNVVLGVTWVVEEYTLVPVVSIGPSGCTGCDGDVNQEPITVNVDPRDARFIKWMSIISIILMALILIYKLFGY